MPESTFQDHFKYQLEIHLEDGWYWAQVTEMPGCFASGRDLEDLQESLAEAIGMYLSSESVKVTVDEIEIEGLDPRAVVHGVLLSA